MKVDKYSAADVAGEMVSNPQMDIPCWRVRLVGDGYGFDIEVLFDGYDEDQQFWQTVGYVGNSDHRVMVQAGDKAKP